MSRLVRAFRLWLLAGQLRAAQRDAAELEAFHATYQPRMDAALSRIQRLRASMFYIDLNHRPLRVGSCLAGNSGLARHRKESA